MWADAQRDDRPTQHRWRSLLNATVRLTPTARVPCNRPNAANVVECKIWTQSEFCTWQNSVRGQESLKMYIQCTSPGDGQTSCKVWLTSVAHRRCSKQAKTRNRLKFACVPQTRQQISSVSKPKFTILWAHVEEILLFNRFFPIVDMCVSCEDIARQSCAMVPIWRIFGYLLGPAFPASRVQHISDLHSKFALELGRHLICDLWV